MPDIMRLRVALSTISTIGCLKTVCIDHTLPTRRAAQAIAAWAAGSCASANRRWRLAWDLCRDLAKRQQEEYDQFSMCQQKSLFLIAIRPAFCSDAPDNHQRKPGPAMQPVSDTILSLTSGALHRVACRSVCHGDAA
jgi:hypothetical protein